MFNIVNYGVIKELTAVVTCIQNAAKGTTYSACNSDNLMKKRTTK